MQRAGDGHPAAVRERGDDEPTQSALVRVRVRVRARAGARVRAGGWARVTVS